MAAHGRNKLRPAHIGRRRDGYSISKTALKTLAVSALPRAFPCTNGEKMVFHAMGNLLPCYGKTAKPASMVWPPKKWRAMTTGGDPRTPAVAGDGGPPWGAGDRLSGGLGEERRRIEQGGGKAGRRDGAPPQGGGGGERGRRRGRGSGILGWRRGEPAL